MAGDTTFVPGTDLPLSDTDITLSGVDIFGNTVFAATTTDANGMYIFTGLVAGNYTVSVADPGKIAIYDLDGVGTKNKTSFVL
jgi:hypothetical protein